MRKHCTCVISVSLYPTPRDRDYHSPFIDEGDECQMKELVVGTQLAQWVVRFQARSVFLPEPECFHCQCEWVPEQLAYGGSEWATCEQREWTKTFLMMKKHSVSVHVTQLGTAGRKQLDSICSQRAVDSCIWEQSVWTAFTCKESERVAGMLSTSSWRQQKASVPFAQYSKGLSSHRDLFNPSHHPSGKSPLQDHLRMTKWGRSPVFMTVDNLDGLSPHLLPSR